MNKKVFKEAEINIIKVEIQDILATSPCPTDSCLDNESEDVCTSNTCTTDDSLAKETDFEF